jgi:hypothetical protein
MELSGMGVAVEAQDVAVLGALRLYREAIVESNFALAGYEAALARKLQYEEYLHEAVQDYYQTLGDEISVAPACKCECKGS